MNENGELAVKYAEQIVREAKEMKESLVAHERARHTIFLGSCAPAPLWTLLPNLSALYPDMTITSEIRGLDTLQEKLLDKTYQLIALPYPIEEPGFASQEIGEEHLYFTLPSAHPLAEKKSLHLADLNGETMLLRPNLGFWTDIVKKAMPDTSFLTQDENAFDELVRFSVLPTFATDLALQRYNPPEGRVIVPIEDEAVNIHYYCCYRKNTLSKLTKLLQAKGKSKN